MHPPVRSFRRRGRMTPSRRLRYAQFAPRFMIDTAEIAAWQPTIVDIGFGGGESVVASATERPDERILGVEVHEAGITHLLTDLAQANLTNVRVVRTDILEVLPDLAVGSLDEMCVFFPDPWPKISHTNRRLIRTDVVHAFSERLRTGGLLRLATDADFYAEQMRDVCDAELNLTRAEPPPRVMTKYERRGRDAGRSIVDLAYARV
jgi:tRNA (guanine-N7-)-methyltransferase